MSVTGPGILLSTGSLYIYPLRRAFEVARSAGCDGVELAVSPELILGGPQVASRLAAKIGLPIRAVHPPLYDFPGWRRDSRVIVQLADLALAVDAPVVVLHPPKARRFDDPALADFAAGLAAAQRRLQGTGIELTLENPGFFYPCDHQHLLWHLPALRRFAEQHGLKLTLDTTHVGASSLSLLESYEVANGCLAHVHLSDLRTPPPPLDLPLLDSYFKHHQLPGAGYLPLAQLLHALARDGYRGHITLEVSPVSLRIWNLAETRRILAQAVLYTRRLLTGGACPGEDALPRAAGARQHL